MSAENFQLEQAEFPIGRDLNEKVALEVMGWHEVEDDWVDENGNIFSHKSQWAPSADMQDMLRILDHLKMHYGALWVIHYSEGDCSVYVSAGDLNCPEDGSYNPESGHGYTHGEIECVEGVEEIPHATCLAALKFMRDWRKPKAP